MHAPTSPPLSVDLLLKAYCAGYFPMADSRDADTVYWVEPRQRGVLPLDGFHLPRSLAKVVRADRFKVTVDTAFAQVIAGCAAPKPGRADTWINRQIIDCYSELHRRRIAHSVECWSGAELVGGLYGVALGGAFFGESMFHLATDASKVALVHLVARLRFGGFTLLDCQFMTSHLARFGVIELSRKHYLTQLAAALPLDCDFHGLDRWASAQSGSAGTVGAGGAGVVGAVAASGAGSAGTGGGGRTTTVFGPVSGKDILHWTTQAS